MTNLEYYIMSRRFCIKEFINSVYGLPIPRGRSSFGLMHYKLSQYFKIKDIALQACSNLTKFYIYSGKPTNIPKIKMNDGVRHNYICIDEFNLNCDILKGVGLI